MMRHFTCHFPTEVYSSLHSNRSFALTNAATLWSTSNKNGLVLLLFLNAFGWIVLKLALYPNYYTCPPFACYFPVK